MPPWSPLERALELRRNGRADEAIAFVDATMEALNGRRHWRRRVALLNERALAEIQIGQGATARDTLLAALDILQEAGSTSSALYATVADNLGFVEREAGDFASASEWHAKAMDIYERTGNRADLTRALLNAAIVSKSRGLLSKARAQLERAMSVVPPRNLRLRGHLYATAALLSQITQEFDRARRQHLLSLIAYRRAGDRENEALQLHNLAIVERLRDRPAAAARCLRKSMALNERLGLAPGTARDLQYLGLFTFDGGQRQEGLRILRQAWHALAAVGDAEGMLWCELDLVRIGTVAGAYETARELLDNAMLRAGDVGDPRLDYNLLVARGRIHEHLGSIELAMRDYESAIERSESLRAEIRDEDDVLNFFRFGQWAAFDALIELAARECDTLAAWRCCQSAKTRELQRLLRFDSGINPRGVGRGAIDCERSLLALYRRAMADWGRGNRAEALPRIEAIERDLASRWDEMSTHDPEYVALRRGRAISYTELRELLRDPC